MAVRRTRIRARSEWGARHDDGAGEALTPARRLFLHHSVTRARNGAEAVRELEGIGESRFGYGISYTFVITPDGTVWQGHSVNRRGTHTGGHNTTARAVVLVGNYDVLDVTPEQVAAVADLGADGADAGWWTEYAALNIDPHQAVKATACPGRRAVAALPKIRTEVARRLADPRPDPTPGGFTMTDAQFSEVLRRFDQLDAAVQAARVGITLDEASDAADRDAILSAVHKVHAAILVHEQREAKLRELLASDGAHPAWRREVAAILAEHADLTDALDLEPLDRIAPAELPAPAEQVRR